MVKEAVHFLEAQQLCVLKHDFEPPLLCWLKLEQIYSELKTVNQGRRRTRRHEKVTSLTTPVAVHGSETHTQKKVKNGTVLIHEDKYIIHAATHGSQWTQLSRTRTPLWRCQCCAMEHKRHFIDYAYFGKCQLSSVAQWCWPFTPCNCVQQHHGTMQCKKTILITILVQIWNP